MDGGDWVMLFVVVILLVFFGFIIWMGNNAPKWNAEKDCERLTIIYGDYFELDESKCVFESLQISVDFEDVDSHIIIRNELE
jgi:hypothetical protein